MLDFLVYEKTENGINETIGYKFIENLAFLMGYEDALRECNKHEMLRIINLYADISNRQIERIEDLSCMRS